jgi:hypothetical protein
MELHDFSVAPAFGAAGGQLKLRNWVRNGVRGGSVEGVARGVAAKFNMTLNWSSDRALSIADCLREHTRQLPRLIGPCGAPKVDVMSKEELFDRS